MCVMPYILSVFSRINTVGSVRLYTSVLPVSSLSLFAPPSYILTMHQLAQQQISMRVADIGVVQMATVAKSATGDAGRSPGAVMLSYGKASQIRSRHGSTLVGGA